MRRAPIALVLSLALVALAPVTSRPAPQTVNLVDGIGLIDYSHKPAFKVGDYVRYHITSNSVLGAHDDYVVTVLIAGEEEWWGEKCFWIETWTEAKGASPMSVATLMSYAIFDDSLAYRSTHQQNFCRKTIGSMSEVGQEEQLMKLAGGAARRRDLLADPGLTERMEELGTDTVQTPMGTFQTTKRGYRTGASMTNTLGDSTTVDEDWNFSTRYTTPAVPLSGIAKEDMQRVLQRKAWMIGRSGDASPMRIREDARGVARLVEFGHGLASRVLPKERQVSFEDLARRARAQGAAAAPRRRATR